MVGLFSNNLHFIRFELRYTMVWYHWNVDNHVLTKPKVLKYATLSMLDLVIFGGGRLFALVL